MLQVNGWPNIILHLDGDSFFASVSQAVNPALKGKPVVTGAERGIATAISLEAKKLGIHRGMRMYEIKKKFPQCRIVNSDYGTYQLFSQRMFSILRSFTPTVEEYSIDEAFADLKGLRSYFMRAKQAIFFSPTCVDEPVQEKDFFTLGGKKKLSVSGAKKSTGYYAIGQAIKSKIESSLGITISVGISLTKSLAKLASNFNKPSGLTVIDGPSIEKLLEKIPVKDIWGIGTQTSAYLNKLNVFTALDYVSKPEEFIKKYLTKPFFEIWQELRGYPVYALNTQSKNTYRSLTRSATFHPPSNNTDVLWARLTSHIEEAFKKARDLNYQIGKLIIFLKTQQFKYHAMEIDFPQKVSYPLLVKKEIKKSFLQIYQPKTLYRTTGCTITDLEEDSIVQTSLFHDNLREQKAKKIYPLYEQKKVDFGSSLFIRDKTIKDSKKLRIPILTVNCF